MIKIVSEYDQEISQSQTADKLQTNPWHGEKLPHTITRHLVHNEVKKPAWGYLHKIILNISKCLN